MNPPDSNANRRILIVDDNPVIHEDYRKILCPTCRVNLVADRLEEALFDERPPVVEPPTFELDSAYQGQEGLEMVQKALAANRPYALAFVDVRMPPGWDGVETISRIWEVYPLLQVVVCTAYSDYTWDNILAKVGQPDKLVILKKPFDNVEVQQLALALTEKWSRHLQTGLKLAELQNQLDRRTAELADAKKSLASFSP